LSLSTSSRRTVTFALRASFFEDNSPAWASSPTMYPFLRCRHLSAATRFFRGGTREQMRYELVTLQ
jgi:hypothetical protein